MSSTCLSCFLVVDVLIISIWQVTHWYRHCMQITITAVQVWYYYLNKSRQSPAVGSTTEITTSEPATNPQESTAPAFVSSLPPLSSVDAAHSQHNDNSFLAPPQQQHKQQQASNTVFSGLKGLRLRRKRPSGSDTSSTFATPAPAHPVAENLSTTGTHPAGAPTKRPSSSGKSWLQRYTSQRLQSSGNRRADSREIVLGPESSENKTPLEYGCDGTVHTLAFQHMHGTTSARPNALKCGEIVPNENLEHSLRAMA